MTGDTNQTVYVGRIRYKLMRGEYHGYKTVIGDENLNILIDIPGNYAFAEALALRIVAALNAQRNKFVFIDEYLEGDF